MTTYTKTSNADSGTHTLRANLALANTVTKSILRPTFF